MAYDKKIYIRIVAPVTIVIGYAFMCNIGDTIEIWTTVGCIYIPLLRGFCAISIGVLIEHLEHNKKYVLLNHKVVAVLEVIILAVIGIGIFAEETWDYLVLIAFSALIFFTVTEQGYIGNKLNKERRSIKWMGDMSYTLYLNHSVISKGFGFINHYLDDISRAEYVVEAVAFWVLLFCYSIITKKIVKLSVNKIKEREKE